MKTIRYLFIFVCLSGCLAHGNDLKNEMERLGLLNAVDHVDIIGRSEFSDGLVNGHIYDSFVIKEFIHQACQLKYEIKSESGKFATKYELDITFFKGKKVIQQMSIVADSVIILGSKPSKYYDYGPLELRPALVRMLRSVNN